MVKGYKLEESAAAALLPRILCGLLFFFVSFQMTDWLRSLTFSFSLFNDDHGNDDYACRQNNNRENLKPNCYCGQLANEEERDVPHFACNNYQQQQISAAADHHLTSRQTDDLYSVKRDFLKLTWNDNKVTVRTVIVMCINELHFMTARRQIFQ